MTHQTEPLLTSADACEALSIDRSTLSRWVQLGRIAPAMKAPESGEQCSSLPTRLSESRPRWRHDRRSISLAVQHERPIRLRVHRASHPDYAPKLTIDERWALWKAANPWVLLFVENLAANLIAKGHRRIGVKQLWEVLRYSYDANTVGSAFRANNDFTSRAARVGDHDRTPP